MAAYDSTTTSAFALTVKLGNSEVTINPGDFNKIAEEGLHFQLPDGQIVEIGQLKEFITWVNEKFSAGLPTEADASWPTPIKDVLNGVLTTTVSVGKLKIDQDKKDAEGQYPPIDLELNVKARATNPIDLVPGLSVTAVAVDIKRKHKKKETLRTPPPQTPMLQKKRR